MSSVTGVSDCARAPGARLTASVKVTTEFLSMVNVPFFRLVLLAVVLPMAPVGDCRRMPHRRRERARTDSTCQGIGRKSWAGTCSRGVRRTGGWRGRARRRASGHRVGLITPRAGLVPVHEVNDSYDCGCSRVEIVIVVNFTASFEEHGARWNGAEAIQIVSLMRPDRSLNH